MKIGEKSTSVICPTSGRFSVRWSNKTMPHIKRGQYITFTGKMITLNLGEILMIVNARLMKPRTIMDVKKYIFERMIDDEIIEGLAVKKARTEWFSYREKERKRQTAKKKKAVAVIGV